MGLDAVVIATPPFTHYEIAKDCLQAGLHVFVEKPITLDSLHAKELVELADQKELILMTGHTFEYNPAVQTLKEIVESGELGRICYVDAARLNLGLFQPKLNALWDLAPHDLSIIIYVLGKDPLSASAAGITSILPEKHDVVYLNLEFPDNILAHLHVSWLDPCKVRRVTVVGTKKMVVYNDIDSLERIKIYDKGVEAPAYTNSFEEFQLSYRYGDILVPNINFKEPLKIESQHFLDCIKDGTQPRSDGRSGMKIVSILESAQQALENGGTYNIAYR
jgi:predicted dehydrogenase